MGKGVIVGVVVGVVAVVVLLLVLAVAPALNANEYEIFEGAYAEWDYSTVVLFVHISGTMRVEFIDVSSSTYTVVMSCTGDVPIPTETETYSIDDGPTAVWDIGTSQGMEYVHTIYGTKYLGHYVEYDGTTTSDYYVGQENNWPYRIVINESGYTIPFDISDTNIDWIKNG